MKITKTLILPGTRGQELWVAGDTYARAAGPEMIGTRSFSQETEEDGQVGSGAERFRSGNGVSTWCRRSADNGLSWTLDREPTWELTAADQSSPYGYLDIGPYEFILDEKRDRLIRFTNVSLSFGPLYYGAGSPTFRQNRMFYGVSHDGGRTWTPPRQVVAEGFRDSQGGKYFWLDWAPGVRWGANGGFIYRGSVRQLVDATLLTGFYRWGGMLREPAGADECCVLRMRWREDAADTLVFEFGQFITIAPEISEKGISEPSFEFLDDGRIFVTLRASGNARTGTWARRYYALSTDQGRTWGPPTELKYDDGTSINVPESMSHVIRSPRTDKVYWLGNVCTAPARTCAPRNRLVIAELDQRKPAVRRDTVTTIDESPLGGVKEMKYSNYVLYVDRFSRNLIVVMSEMAAVGEQAAPDHVSNGYRYEIEAG